MNEEVSEHKRRGGVPSRDELYRKVANHAIGAINVLVEEMTKPTKMSGARVAAARTLLSKALPDLKAVEVAGDSARPLFVKLDDNPSISTQTSGSVESA
jgi:hypothetical protein